MKNPQKFLFKPEEEYDFQQNQNNTKKTPPSYFTKNIPDHTTIKKNSTSPIITKDEYDNHTQSPTNSNHLHN